MIRFPGALIATAAFLVTASAHAQTRRRPPELDRLGGLVGTFEGVVRIERAGADPLTGRMRYTARWELDSAWIVARYEQTLMGRSTSGLLMYSWDAASSRYLFYGFPNTPMQPNRLRGKFEDGAFVFESDSGAGFDVRETWLVVSRDTIVTAISGRRGGGEWVAGPRTVLVRIPD